MSGRNMHNISLPNQRNSGVVGFAYLRSPRNFTSIIGYFGYTNGLFRYGRSFRS